MATKSIIMRFKFTLEIFNSLLSLNTLEVCENMLKFDVYSNIIQTKSEDIRFLRKKLIEKDSSLLWQQNKHSYPIEKLYIYI